MAEFNFNAMQQAVHNAHASMSDPHAEPTDIQYIPPTDSSGHCPHFAGQAHHHESIPDDQQELSPDKDMYAAQIHPVETMSDSELAAHAAQALAISARNVDAFMHNSEDGAPDKSLYSSHQAMVTERMQQLHTQRIEQARAELAANALSSEDIPPLKPDAVADIKTANHTSEASQPPAEPGKAKTARQRGAATALEGTPGINIDNCPLLVWLALNRLHVDASAKGYVFERDEVNYEYLRPVSDSRSTVKVKIDIPEGIPRTHNDAYIVVTAQQLRAARADIVAYIKSAARSDMTERLLSALADALTVPAKDIKRTVPGRATEAPVTEVTMLDALRVHLLANGFKKFGDRGKFDWQWPYQEDASGRRVFAALSYDGKYLTYSYQPDRQPLSEWELLPNGRINMTEFTRTNRTRIAARDYVCLEQLLNNVAGLAFTDSDIRVPFFDAINGCPALVDLGAALLIECAGITLHHQAVALLNQSLQPNDGTWHRLIYTFIVTELIKNNAIHDEQTRMIYSEAAARHIIGIFTK